MLTFIDVPDERRGRRALRQCALHRRFVFPLIIRLFKRFAEQKCFDVIKNGDSSDQRVDIKKIEEDIMRKLYVRGGKIWGMEKQLAQQREEIR